MHISRRIRKSALGLLAIVGCLPMVLAQPGFAQTGQVNPLDDFKPNDNRDPFSSNGNASSGVMDLIHRATLGQLKDPSEFRLEQQQNLNDAAAQFRARQLQLIRGQQGTVPTATDLQPGVK